MREMNIRFIIRNISSQLDGDDIPILTLEGYLVPTKDADYDIFDHISRIINPKVSLEYSKIIFNPPATIIIWKDGTKTVVKCSEEEIFDYEKGISMCFMKKVLSGSDYSKILKRCDREERKISNQKSKLQDPLKTFSDKIPKYVNGLQGLVIAEQLSKINSNVDKDDIENQFSVINETINKKEK